MSTKRALVLVLGVSLAILVGVGIVRWSRSPVEFPWFPGRPIEEVVTPPRDPAGGRTPEQLAEVATDVFAKMDGGIKLSADEIKGRNTWLLWTAGNEQFWDRMARHSYGLIDLLKSVDSRNRGSRFKEKGLVNEPGFAQADRPDEHGVWLDRRVGPEPEGVDPGIYGRSSGIIGFRIYPNPDFDEQARKRWDPERYYSDESYYNNPGLVRPYRVGMTCALCHVAPHPLNPPEDPENPAWEDLASLIGNQYFHEGRSLVSGVRPGSFFREMLEAQPNGTSDTSRIATDHVNNPNTMNAIFNLGARLSLARAETVTGGTLDLPPGADPKPVPGGMAWKVPHILKDGSDSVGVPGASIRVYVNIGMFSQQWLQCHNPLIGFEAQKPFSVANAQKHSTYWMATQARLANLAKFFMRMGPMPLADAPGGAAYLSKDVAVLERGKVAFAENCAKCHSSKRPPGGMDPESDEAIAWFSESVAKPDFLEGNFLSEDKRHPITRIGTNAARAVATNAKSGHVWDQFSSQTYKDSPSVGIIDTYNPRDPGSPRAFEVPGGGGGYYRTPSLIGIWATAPFLHNNALGDYNGDPSVKGRMAAFDDAAEKLLWPEKRLGPESIWRTRRESFLEIPIGVIPEHLQRPLRDLVEDDYLKIGPIPEGTPINLLANLDPSYRDLLRLIPRLKLSLLRIRLERMDADAAKEQLAKLVPDLLAASKCPDLVEDRGHTFGAGLEDGDKRALIEFLKTF